MFCTSCGGEIREGAKFCIHCGAAQKVKGSTGNEFSQNESYGGTYQESYQEPYQEENQFGQVDDWAPQDEGGDWTEPVEEAKVPGGLDAPLLCPVSYHQRASP